MAARTALATAKSGRPISARRRRLGVAAIVLAPAIMFSDCALADEGGVSFWIPGLFGSLAATPQQPGWSMANIYYHTSVSAGADVARAREFTLGRVPGNVTVNANLNLNLNATGDLGFVLPSYVFATPVLGGQASSFPRTSLAWPAPVWRGPCQAWPRGLSVITFPSCCPTPLTTRHGALAIWRRCSN